MRIPFHATTLPRFAAAVGTALALAAPGVARAQSPVLAINEAAAKDEIVVTPLRGNMSMLAGAGGNIAVYNADAGKFLVDAGIGVAKDRLSPALAKLGPQPVKYVVNTHWHWDHSDGNTWMQKTGATIIGHPNAKKHMSKTSRVENWDYTFKPWPKEGLPSVLVSSKKTMRFGGEKIWIENVGKGHTDGDLWVYFEKANLIALGDIFWNGVYPFIDNEYGGGIDTVIAWVNKALARTNADTMVVPGHGPAGTRADLVDYRDMLVAVRAEVAALKKQGKTVEEVIAAKPTARYDAKYGNFLINPAFFTKLVYVGIK